MPVRLHIDTPLPSACAQYAAECLLDADQLVALSSMLGRLVSVDAIVARRRLRREARYAHEVARRWQATTVEKGRGDGTRKIFACADQAKV
jgi:hypothetical protein